MVLGNMSEDIDILVGMYRDMERRYTEAGLSTGYLKSTAGVELFDTDHTGLPPAESYVLSSLARAEEHLNRHLSGQPRKKWSRNKWI